MATTLTTDSRVLHHRFACLGTVKQVSTVDGALRVEWDIWPSKTDQWYTAEELIDVTGEGV
jgi:hypothetical protein